MLDLKKSDVVEHKQKDKTWIKPFGSGKRDKFQNTIQVLFE